MTRSRLQSSQKLQCRLLWWISLPADRGSRMRPLPVCGPSRTCAARSGGGGRGMSTVRWSSLRRWRWLPVRAWSRAMPTRRAIPPACSGRLIPSIVRRWPRSLRRPCRSTSTERVLVLVMRFQKVHNMPLELAQISPLHDHRAEDDECRAGTLVPQDGFPQVPMCEQEARSHRDCSHERYRGERKVFEGFVVAEDEQEARDQSVAEQHAQKLPGECLQLGHEWMRDERREQEEECNRAAGTHDDDHLRF